MSFEIDASKKNSAYAGMEGAGGSYHKGHTHWRDYDSESKISKRINWDYGVYDHKEGTDQDGVFTLEWTEKPTPAARAAVITSAVVAALAVAAIEAAAIMAATFGLGAALAAAVFVVAEVAAVATAIALLEMRERQLKATFITESLHMVNTNEAEKIKNLNKDKIQQKLTEIAKLLDDKKEDTFDLDKAIDELKTLSTEQITLDDGQKLDLKDIFSSKNKEQFEKLQADHAIKLQEYTTLITDHSNEILEKIDKVKDDFEENCRKLRDEMAEEHQAKMDSFNDIFTKLDENEDVMAEFQAALNDSKEKHDELITKEGEIQSSIEELQEEFQARFSTTKEKINELNRQIVEEMDALCEEITSSREVMEERFQKIQEERNSNFENAKFQFNKLIAQYFEHTQGIEKNFALSREDRQKKYANNNQLSEQLFNSIKQYEQNFIERLEFESKQRHEENLNQINLIQKLKISSEEGFLQAINDSEHNSRIIETEILEVRREVDEAFEKAARERQEQYELQERQLQEVENQVLEQRREADEAFEKAARERQEQYELQERQLQEVENQVLEQRKEADEAFEKAARERQEQYKEGEEQLTEVFDKVLEARNEIEKEFLAAKIQREKFYEENRNRLSQLNEEQKLLKEELDKGFTEATADRARIYEKTSAQLQEVNENVNTAREEINTNFKKAEEHRNEIYEKTSAQLQEVNENVNTAREEINTNFKKAEEHRNEIYEKTSAQLQEVNENVNTAREEINTNFKKAEEHRNQNLEEISQKLGELQSAVIQREACIKLLQARKENFDYFEDLLQKNTHPQILEIQSKQKDENGLALFNKSKAQKEIRELIIKVKNTESLDQAESLLNQAFEISIKGASLFGNTYQPDQADEFQVKAILSLKNKQDFDKHIEKTLQNFNKQSSEILSFILNQVKTEEYDDELNNVLKNKPEELNKMMKIIMSENSELQKLIASSEIDNDRLKVQIQEMFESFITNEGNTYLESIQEKVMGEVLYT
jgi:hypothetical protein